jgi:regulatory protein
MSEAKLADAAIFYLSRFASSSGNLRQVLRRKIMRSARHYGDDPEPLLAQVETMLERYIANGTLDDTAYAETQTRKLRGRGGSARIIGQRLTAKGVPSEIVAENAVSLNEPGVDRAAAAVFARRRRLGPFRTGERADHRQRDLAAMGRAGFGYAIAAAIIDAADSDSLDALLREE